MFEDIPGRLIGGAMWGLGAGIVLRLVNNKNSANVVSEPRVESPRTNPIRPVAKTLIKGYVLAADGVSRLTAEARETLGDLYAEAQADGQHTAHASEPLEPKPGDTGHTTAAPSRPRSRRPSAASAQAPE